MDLKESFDILEENGYKAIGGNLPSRPVNGPTPDNITLHLIQSDYELTNWYDEAGWRWTMIVDDNGKHVYCNGKM